ncbi:SAM-dependent methyltransferase [Clostridium baratii]|uniref:Type 11 methyltransferase n=1 Tax=Clostridium baratii TaxID=1561 RepID=A0A174PZI0_9CLOT|nr:class I SAM-dependent methyltransferase [Clostridium baratii]OPF51822.1 SAM-dependent methyltransferase [Clostridium baratii]OPF53468.1 SAM-dependent methyltransferase [Clostridium baratii]OPF57387.1 SAM-dependent methyltransferase [Clostridium baratii]OPF60515.1 SAM-dependent methyltransferase [Clostridium baratii]CUP66413.1 type 11 methyltransferase [Clostridium baratii]
MAYEKFAKVYDELINEDIDYEKIANRLKEIMDMHNIKYDDYLDLACGTGNVSLKLANSFKDSFAVDLSEDMLIEAFNKFKKEKIKSKLVCQDMTELELNHKFDLISCVLDSTNYILEEEDLKSYFNCVYNHLKEDGIFVFDINSYYKLSNILGNNIYTYNSEDVFYSWENVFEDEIVNMFLTFFIKDGDLYEKFEEEHYERAYKESEIESILKDCNFKILDKFEGYDNKRVCETSERILYVVKKEMEE